MCYLTWFRIRNYFIKGIFMGKDSKISVMENSIFACAGRFGILGSALTSVGAVLRNRNAHDETLTMLVGGIYVGALLGLVNSLLPETNENSSNCLKFTTAVFQVGLGVAASLTAPLVGEGYLHYNTQWNETVIDYYTGAAIVAAGAIVIGSAIGCGVGCVNGSAPSFFFKKKEAVATAMPGTMEIPEQEKLRPTTV
jgi:hypothetical protein